MEIAQTEFENNGLKHPKKFIKFISPSNNFILNILLQAVDLGVNTCDGTDFPLFSVLFATRNIPQIVGDYCGFPEWFDICIKHNDEYVHPKHGSHSGGEGYLMDVDKLVQAMQTFADLGNTERIQYSNSHLFKWKTIFQTFSTFVLNNKKEIENNSKNENFVVRSLS